MALVRDHASLEYVTVGNTMLLKRESFVLRSNDLQIQILSTFGNIPEDLLILAL